MFQIPFQYQSGQLCCEKTILQTVAEEFGTPLYVYSKNGILDAYHELDQAFGGIDHTICYALKANANPTLLKLLAESGAGADVVSGGELKLALEAGFPPKQIVYASVGKTDDEIRFAINSGIGALNVESRQELEVTTAIAAEMGEKAPIAVRINPDIDIEGHPYLTTGRTANKFGIELNEARECYIWGAGQPSLDMVGVHSHIGSMIKKTAPFRKSAETLVTFVEDLRSEGIELKHIDIGGGIGVDYTHVLAEQGSTFLTEPAALAKEVLPIIEPTGCELFFEPGRSIAGPNGVLLTKVLFTKTTKGKEFVVVDAAMNDLIRPSLYGAYHEVLPLARRDGSNIKADVVGPICESGDFFAKERELPQVERGDYLAIMTAGAYGYVLASTYNQRPRPAELLIDEDKYELIRERERL